MDYQASKGWLDHAIEAEYLFLKNIYDQDQTKNKEIENLEDYWNNICRLINHFKKFEDSVKCGDISDNIRDIINLDVFETFRDLRDDIDS